MLNYNHLHYFHVAATEGSVAAAAEKLGVTQPTVSEQLRALERSLGVTLFDRSPTGLRLTESGRLAFEHTSVMFRAGERLVESLGHETREMPKCLRIGLSSAVARATSSDFLMPLLALPDCIPVIRTADSVDLLRAMRSSELDLVLVENEPPDTAKRGLEAAVIAGATTLVAIAPVTLEVAADWQDVGFIHYRASSSYRWEVESFLASRKLQPRIAAEADDSSFILEAATRGYIAVVPRSIAREKIASGKLCVLAQFEPTHAGVHALYHDGSSAELARRAVQILIDHVK